MPLAAVPMAATATATARAATAGQTDSTSGTAANVVSRTRRTIPSVSSVAAHAVSSRAAGARLGGNAANTTTGANTGREVRPPFIALSLPALLLPAWHHRAPHLCTGPSSFVA